MKRLLLPLFSLLIILFPFTLTLANNEPPINAIAAILMDGKTGQALFVKNANAIMEPASTTKIMTAIIAIERGNLNKTIAINSVAAKQEGTSMHLKPNERLTLKNLLYGLLLSSGNDAATAIADYFSGTESDFARLMTTKARTLGMDNTEFKNASGLPAYGHYTTAYDMALLAKYALQNPVFAQIVQTKVKFIPGPSPKTYQKLTNHNKLLWQYPYATGIKTGYTINAGGCLVASAKQQGNTLIAVVLKSNAIYADCQKLFNYGFEALEREEASYTNDKPAKANTTHS